MEPIRQPVSDPDFKPFGLAVPNYRALGIPGPYFGDMVWEHLKTLDTNKLFEYVPVRLIGFPDRGENVKIDENVRNKDIYVIHSLYVIPAQHVMIGAETCDALIRSDAARVQLVELFNPYFRQDTRNDREPVTARLVAEFYKIAGMDMEYTADPHSKQLTGMFQKLEPLPMTRRLTKRVREAYDTSKAVVGASDAGSVERAERFANALGLPLVYIHKRRIDERTVMVERVVGDVDDKDVFLRDDIISTGGTTITDARALRDLGAKKVYNVATHLELCENAKENLRSNDIRVIGTNSVPVFLTNEEKKYVDVVDISDIIGDVVFKKAMGGSLRKFFSERE